MKFPFCFFLLLSSWVIAQEKPLSGAFDRIRYYEAMAGGNVSQLDQQLFLLEKAASANERAAFAGALLMKKSGLIKGAGKKLDLFKEGKLKLENSISKDPQNAEFHFLRLMIQENAPSFLHYSGDMDADKNQIIYSFKNLPPDTGKAVHDYCKTSRIIHCNDLSMKD